MLKPFFYDNDNESYNIFICSANNTNVDNIINRVYKVFIKLQTKKKADSAKYIIRLHSFCKEWLVSSAKDPKN
jgi:hypothetical protein